MTDKEAIEVLKQIPVLFYGQRMNGKTMITDALTLAIHALKRSEGRWVRKRVDKHHYLYYCNRCGHESRFYKSNYCHYCGAKMQKEEV